MSLVQKASHAENQPEATTAHPKRDVHGHEKYFHLKALKKKTWSIHKKIERLRVETTHFRTICEVDQSKLDYQIYASRKHQYLMLDAPMTKHLEGSRILIQD